MYSLITMIKYLKIKNNNIMKCAYTKPELAVITVNLEGNILIISDPSGAQSTGFTTAGTYVDGDWDID